jgi:hypothetical protein
VDIVALADGDTSWVLGDADVRHLLVEADGHLTAIASGVGGSLGPAGSGLEFRRRRDAAGGYARTDLVGVVRSPRGVSFRARLTPTPEGFEVTATITGPGPVSGSGPESAEAGEPDCGEVRVLAARPVAHLREPKPAAVELLRAVRWLRVHAITQAPEHWTAERPPPS